MSTPTSISTSYATGSDAMAWFDVRVIGDCLGDDGARVASVDMPSHPTLATLLSGASGEVESAALKGHRYEVADLQALTGASLAFLKQLVVYLGVGRALWRRQPTSGPTPILTWAEEKLAALERGELIFGLVEVQDAGVESLPSRTIQSVEDQNRVINRAGRILGGFGSNYPP